MVGWASRHRSGRSPVRPLGSVRTVTEPSFRHPREGPNSFSPRNTESAAWTDIPIRAPKPSRHRRISDAILPTIPRSATSLRFASTVVTFSRGRSASPRSRRPSARWRSRPPAARMRKATAASRSRRLWPASTRPITWPKGTRPTFSSAGAIRCCQAGRHSIRSSKLRPRRNSSSATTTIFSAICRCRERQIRRNTVSSL